MPDFKKITQMIKSYSRDRYVIVEEGKPAWVVLSIDDYEDLVKGERELPKKDQRSEKKIDEALLSYQEELEKEEENVPEEKKEPELYFEEVEKGADLSTSSLAEEDEDMEFDTIPF